MKHAHGRPLWAKLTSDEGSNTVSIHFDDDGGGGGALF